MSLNHCEKSYEVLVAGGGLSGICAAIASARHGVRTAIIQNRSMFGGNASSEIRMHIVGANSHAAKKDLAETGIIMEILLENKHRNPYGSFPVFDSILWEKVHFQENLDSYLNTSVDDVVMEEGEIRQIICHQNTTETEYTFSAKIFIDATGHGTLGTMARAAWRSGSEGQGEFGEPGAPLVSNTDTQGNTILFSAIDRGEPVRFHKPFWANSYTEEDLKFRPHHDGIGSHADGGELTRFEEHSGRLPHFSNVDSGYWWIELGGDRMDIIREGEDIRDELLQCVYGVWDHLKNCGDHGVDTFDLDWVGMVPGYRESRRLEGDYLLNELDVRSNRIFHDAVAYGGWQMDEHIRGGIRDLDKIPSRILNFEGCYTIPYRCYYSSNVPNLMLAGRDISTTKMAFGSTRVMGTCAVGGQAAGTAAALAIRHGCTPREVGNHIKELQQQLLKDDCYIPGFANRDDADLARAAQISATSFREGCGPENAINGITRNVGENSNCWESLPLGPKGESIRLDFCQITHVNELRLTFDPNLTQEIMPSLTRLVRERQVKGMPQELVRDYTVECIRNGETVFFKTVSDNYQRLNVHLPDTDCSSIRITVNKTHGHPGARIFEIRAY